jgi:hypothetical protein
MAGTAPDGKKAGYNPNDTLMIQATAPTATTPATHKRTNQASR